VSTSDTGSDDPKPANTAFAGFARDVEADAESERVTLPSWVQEVAFGFAAAVIATGVRAAIDPLLGNKFAYVAVFYAVLAAAWWRGTVAGLSAASVGMVLSIYFWVEPRGALTVSRSDDVIGLLLFFLASLAISFLGGVKLRAERHAQAALARSIASERALRDSQRALQRKADAIRESEQRFRLMADSAPVLIWTSDTAQKFTWFNKAWLEFAGCEMAEAVGDGWAGKVHADDLYDCVQNYVRAFEAREAFVVEYRLRRHDGAYRWMLDNGRPLYEPDGTFKGYIGSCTDITDRKSVEGNLRFIAREIQHRSKNVVSRVKAMILMTRADTVDDYIKALDDRLGAMARVDTLLSETRTVEFERLVTQELAPYQPIQGARIGIHGPTVMLSGRASEALALVVHELATNAAKYGAISHPQGHLAIAWSLPGNERFALDWVETGVDLSGPPQQQGFGTRLITSIVEHQLRGTANLDWRPIGLRFRIEIPTQGLLADT
jgi:PAS domain S-box-containing protein